MQKDSLLSCIETRLVSRDKKLALFIGSPELVTSVLQTEMVLEHIVDPVSARTLFVDRRLDFNSKAQYLHDSFGSPSDVVVFDCIEDISTLHLILVLVKRGVTVWAGVHESNASDAICYLETLFGDCHQDDCSVMQKEHGCSTIHSLWRKLIESPDLVDVIELNVAPMFESSNSGSQTPVKVDPESAFVVDTLNC